jgi:hypothetical protein
MYMCLHTTHHMSYFLILSYIAGLRGVTWAYLYTDEVGRQEQRQTGDVKV